MTVASVSMVDRFRGSLLGLAVGDALGAFFEGMPPDYIRDRFPTKESLIKNPPLAPWHYTDDTQMAIGVTEALLGQGEIDENQLIQIFAENYVPSRGYGRGARMILDAVQDGIDHRHYVEEYFPGGSYGNGAAMRVGPIGMCFRDDHHELLEQARRSSVCTHTHPLGIKGAQLVALAVALASEGQFDKQEFYKVLWSHAEEDEYIELIENASQASEREDLVPLGNGIAAQESAVTAIGCFTIAPDSFEQVIAEAILLGGDTDTIAAMAGAISGAYLGIEAIPDRWLSSLENDSKGRDYIDGLATKLHAKFSP